MMEKQKKIESNIIEYGYTVISHTIIYQLMKYDASGSP